MRKPRARTSASSPPMLAGTSVTGGNGGITKPRHADLLASDLDRETLIKLIDRFAMFHVTSADKLQRTSVWQHLEGGRLPARSDDRRRQAGAGRDTGARYPDPHRQLRVRMVAHPQRREALKRFSHFINSDKRDPDVQFVSERDQHRPATPAERIPCLPESRWRPNDETLPANSTISCREPASAL